MADKVRELVDEIEASGLPFAYGIIREKLEPLLDAAEDATESSIGAGCCVDSHKRLAAELAGWKWHR